MSTRKVYGELSVEDYLRVIGDDELADVIRDRNLERNGDLRARSARETSSSPPRARSRTSSKLAKILGSTALILCMYSAGATWRWDGKWSRDLTMEEAVAVTDGQGYPDDQVRLAMARMRTQINLGLQSLGRAASKEGRPGDRAVTHIRNTMEQAQALYEEVRDR